MSALQQKILVVDDDQAVTRSFERVLSQKGYAVITAASGEEALAKLANEHYDAVFTDIKMPGMSGIEVARQVKANQPWMPVVIVSGFASQKAQHQVAEYGVTQFMNKPLTPEMIERGAEEALRPVPVTMQVIEEELVEQGVKVKETDVLQFLALAIAAPFIGLAFIMALPVLGLAGLAYFSYKALMSTRAKNIVLFLASPFIGLAYVVAMPIVGIGAGLYFGMKAVTK